MEAQGKCSDLTQEEMRWNGVRMEEERIEKPYLNWAAAHSQLAGDQLSANRHTDFGRPTANRVQFGSIYGNVFCDR